MANARRTPKQASELTPRQGEVLALIAAGRTNPEIAASLGISLAGAKWHVSEVLSRLGVASREQAADYWREQHRPAARLARPFRAIAGLSLLKISGIAAAAAATTIGVAAAVVSFHSDGTNEPRRASLDSSAHVASLTEAEAAEHARYAAGEYLRQTDIPQRISFNGTAISVDVMDLAELVFTPAGAVTVTRYAGPYGTRDVATWSATFRIEGLPMPDMGWGDGVLTVSVTFEDETGAVKSASAGSTSKRLEQLPQPTPQPYDGSGRERVSPFYPVTRIDGPELHQTITVYQARDGDWCWAHNSEDGGGGGSSCAVGPLTESPDVFSVAGSGGGVSQGRKVPGFTYGATSSRVARVTLVFESGEPMVLETVAFPAETGLQWRAFASMLDSAGGNLLSIHALDDAGVELSQYDLPRSPKVPPYVVSPLSPIAFSGSGDASGGQFHLPPPAFPVKIALIAESEGSITVDLLCDTASAGIRIIEPGNESLAVVTQSGAQLLIDLPPQATVCSFDIRGTGTWNFRSP